MYSTGFFKTNTAGKCDECSYYIPKHKIYKNLGEVQLCHGICELKDVYKQRTDTCKKVEVVI
ncbi:hypothetical protein K1726_18305 [Clostridium estertheticum]|nr:hypothetical protein [Clostridium estertheticum]MBX4266569.1 hypothetical protein [Clostridium estertheticum]